MGDDAGPEAPAEQPQLGEQGRSQVHDHNPQRERPGRSRPAPDLGDLLARLEGQQIGHVLALGVAPAFGQLIDLGAVDPAQVGEEQQPAVGGGDEKMVDNIT